MNNNIETPVDFKIKECEVTLIIADIYVEVGTKGSDTEPPSGLYYEYTLYFDVPDCDKKVMVPDEMYGMFKDIVQSAIEDKSFGL